MIKSNSFTLSFFLIFLSGMFMCLCSNNWIFIWCGLELSLISILPLMVNDSVLSSESSISYFLVQSMGSSLLVLGLVNMMMMNWGCDLFISISLMIKMGVAPFHLWLLSIIDGLTFMPLIIIFSFAKLPSLMILTFNSSSLVLFIIVSLVLGSVSGLNQSSILKILSYSSIFNMGMMLILINNNFMLLLYLFVYSLLILTFILFSFKMNIFYLSQMVINDELLMNKITLWMTLLSMSGVPPLIGFSIKIMVVEYLILNNLIFILIIISLTSILITFFYFRMSYSSIMIFSFGVKWLLIKWDNYLMLFLVFNLIMIPVYFTLKFSG
nr:NADH dehydrogenase subunit 2 [Elbelus tripunctatus]